jgi:predicted DCC family thiol-disulfide oxidoreductase YuxK
MPVADRVVLYDAECGVCDGFVRFVIARDTRISVRFAPLRGVTAATVRAKTPALEGVDSIVLVEMERDGIERIWVRSEAVLRVAAGFGGVWRVAYVLRFVPRVVRDAAYDAFARWRHRIASPPGSCPVPDEAERARFLP